MNIYYFNSLMYFQLTIKTSFSFPKIIPKSTQMYTLNTNLSFYITFTMFHYIGQG